MRTKKLRLSFVLMLGCLWLNLNAQQPVHFLQYAVRDGLSQNSVHCIHRDRDGLVWIGTQDGLNSFDGKSFTVYRPKAGDSTSISDQFILRIKESNAGLFWIGTRNGLNSFDKKTKKFTSYYLDPGERNVFQAAYYDFFVLNDERVVVTKMGQAVLLDPVTRSMKNISPPGAVPVCWYVFPDYRALFINTDGNLLYSKDVRAGNFIKIGAADKSLHVLRENTDARSLGDSLVMFNDNIKTVRAFNMRTRQWMEPVELPSKIIELNGRRPDELYAATATGIIKFSLYGGQSLIKNDPANDKSLPPGNILCTYTDNEGNLWAGTGGKGIAVNNRSFENYVLVQNVSAGDATSAIAKTGNRIFCATRTGVYFFDIDQTPLEMKPFCPALRGKIITAAAAMERDVIWAAVQGDGLYCIEGNGKIVRICREYGNGLPLPPVLHLDKTGNGKLLISAAGGLFMLNDSKGKIESVPANGAYVMSAREDKSGNVWVSHNSGLDLLSPNLRPLRSFDSNTETGSFIKRSIVTGSTEDRSGNTWIGTIRSGIYRINKGRATHYTTSAGLSSMVIYSLACDNRDRLWAATSAGLNVFDRETNSFVTLTPAEGLPETAFTFGAAIKDEKGNIILGSADGVLICKAASVELQKTIIRAYIDNVRVNGQNIPFGNTGFSLIPDNKLIEFSLASSPAFFSGNLIYQYRLSGLSQDWITLPQGVQTVSYTGLPHGKLTMEVRAAIAESNLGAAPVSRINVTAKTPFWKKPVFLAACVAMFIALIWLSFMEYNKRNYRKQLAILRVEKQLQGERVRIGRDLHDNIGAYTSALIAGLNRIRSRDMSQSQQIDDLKDYGANIMGFLRETIWMLNTEMLTLTAFTDRFKNYALRIAKNYPDTSLQVRENIVKDTSLPPTAMLNIFRILQEALQNAFRHSGATTILITVENDESLCFEVKDNGKGFAEEAKEESYGLSNMRQRAKESNFDLSIRSGEGGTAIQIKENTANAVSPVNNDLL